MKMSHKKRSFGALAALALSMLFCLGAMAAVSELPVTTVKGVKCYYYDVQPKESIYQVANKLGITREQITDHNPSASDGLKPRMRLYFPVSDFYTEPGTRKAVYAAAAGVTTHVVKRGETIYGIARRYGMSPDYLVKLNPQAADGIKTGDELRITEGSEAGEASDAAPAPALQPDADGYVHYEIRQGDTLFSIANANGVTLESIFEANPSIDPLHYSAGQKIRIPVAVVKSRAEADTATHPEPAEEGIEEPALTVVAAEEYTHDDADSPAAGDDADTLAENGSTMTENGNAIVEACREMNVAVILPFMLGEETPSRTTQLYTEFFKGMLMAADTLRNENGAQVKFEFIDTAASSDTVNALLRRPKIGKYNLIVAPDNQEQLEAIADAVSPETVVLNIFAVKDDSYLRHHNVIQANIPHDAMYARAIDAFMDKYAGFTPVFLNRNAGLADKDSFVRKLKERLTQEGRDYRELTFDNSLSDGQLSTFDPDMTPLVFVPNSGSKTEFARFIKAIGSLRERAADSSRVTLFGYPEWVTFRGESFKELCDLDATIYSRFLAIDSQPGLRNLKERYKELYGTEMFEAVPTQGVLGFDTGRLIIEGLRQMAETGEFPTEFDGVQMRLMLRRSGTPDKPSEAGLVNESLYIINHHPGGIVEWEK